MNPETLSKLWEPLRGSSESLVFAGIVLALFGSVVYLLIPQPQYTLQLEPGNPALVRQYQAQTEALPQEELAAVAMADPVVTGKRKSSHSRGPKKPKVIPIVNINTAGVAQLDLLPGVGPKMAARILQYRKGVGKFQTLEELTGVKGIGPKTFNKMKPYLKL